MKVSQAMQCIRSKGFNSNKKVENALLDPFGTFELTEFLSE